jgi:NDP-sugar pyrophosphorylase family protein
MAVNHQADLIKAFFNNGSKWNVNIDYSLETQPLSTIGPLKLIPDLPDNFLLMNGDVLTDLNLRQLYEEHVSEGRLFTIAAARRHHIVDYGVLDADASGNLIGFREKPSVDYTVSMGVYVVNRKMLDMVPEQTKYGFDNLMLDSLRTGAPVHVKFHEGYWLDIGRVDDYMKAIDDFEERRNQLIPDVYN